MPLTGRLLALDGKPSRLVPNTLLVLAACCSAATWLTPNIYEPWLSFHGELWMAVAGLVAGGVVILASGRRTSRLPWLTAGLMVATAVPILQGLAGIVPFAGDAWLTALYLAGAGLAAWAGWLATERWGARHVVTALLVCLLVGASATLYLALCQWQGIELSQFFVLPGENGLRPAGNIGQPNQFATLLVAGVLAIAMLHENGSVGKATSAFAIAFLGFGIAMTQSRTAVLEIALVAAILAAWAWRRRFARLTPVGVAVGAAIVLVMPFAWDAVRHWSPFAATARTVSDLAVAGVRPMHWAALWDAALQRPWWGYGWSGIGAAQFAVAPDHPATHETLNHAHNLVLELIVVNGLPLGLAMVGALALWFRSAATGTLDAATRIAYAAVVAVFVHAMLEYPLHYVDFLAPTAALMGCISCVATPRQSVEVPALTAKVVWMALAAGVAVTAVDYLRFEAERRHMRFKSANIGTPVTSWARSDRLVLTQLGAFWNFLIQPERPGMSTAELDAMEKVVRRFPSVENMLRYSAALALNGRAGEASAVLARGCRMTPLYHCRELSRYWTVLGQRHPEIAAIPWPGLPAEPLPTPRGS